MQLVSYRNTMNGAKPLPPVAPQEAALESKIAFLERRQAELSKELKKLVHERQKAVAAVSYARKRALARFQADQAMWATVMAELQQKRDALLTEIRVISHRHDEEIKDWPKSDRGTYSPTILKICDRICAAFGVTFSELSGHGRNPRTVFARQAVCYWAYRATSLSMSQIGAVLGGRDHSTVVHAKRAYVTKRLRMGKRLKEV
jgi:hypothetical protein